MVPSAATRIAGVNACWLPDGMFIGVRLIWIVGDHVSPPSVDFEKAMLSWAKLLKRLSCQTMYRLPLAGLDAPRSTATSGMMSPVRTRAPVSGSLTPFCSGSNRAFVSSLSTMIGPDQVAPLSDERR